MREGKVRHRSLRTRRGALKKKERIVKGEVERFGVSLARLSAVQEREREMEVDGDGDQSAGGEKEGVFGESQTMEGQASGPAPTSTANRWAALRGFISATMEQNPAFVAKKDAK